MSVADGLAWNQEVAGASPVTPTILMGRGKAGLYRPHCLCGRMGSIPIRLAISLLVPCGNVALAPD